MSPPSAAATEGPGRAPTGARPRPAATLWASQLTDLVRAASGGLLFGVPLLYTMEVWWTGARSSPQQMAVLLALLFVPAFVLNKTAGFRTARDVHVSDAVADTIETVAVGVVLTATVLVLLRQITGETPVSAAVGMVLYESIPFCLGAGVARHFLHGSRDQDDDETEVNDDNEGDGHSRGGELNATLADIGATAIGATFIAISIAPTDEVPMIASAVGPAWLLLLIAASLVISYAIVFVAGFSGQERREAQEGIFQRPLTETMACYVVALIVSAVMLWVFRRGVDPTPEALTRVVVLGLPAAVGGAAGRLAL
jgi:putative integral membrane protein (TIGR02587 family)